jgi:cyanophycinase-like exopeptidase
MRSSQGGPGLIALFGSGETTASGGLIFEALAREIQAPLCMAFLETPAGFELNSPRVVGRVADYVSSRLQNHKLEVRIVAARKKGTAFSPDDLEIIRPLLDANFIFLGPGSPSYAVRQLKDTLAWQAVQARHRLGAALALASAAAIAVGALALPVYEIYKAGEDPHWKQGLNLLGPYGLQLIFVPHWNNTEGGAELDTSRCFMGASRFEALRASAAGEGTIVGIDENTGLILDLARGSCRVLGKGSVTILRDDLETQILRGKSWPLSALGNVGLPDMESGISPVIWEAIEKVRALGAEALPAPTEVQSLLAERNEARMRKQWKRADELRSRILALGWVVSDTPQGSELNPLDPRNR